MFGIKPLSCVAGNVPLKLTAVRAKRLLGAGVSCWRGVRVEKLFAPLVLTAISSHLSGPVNAFPKSTVVVNRPLLTATAVLVTGPATRLPSTLA